MRGKLWLPPLQLSVLAVLVFLGILLGREASTRKTSRFFTLKRGILFMSNWPVAA